MSNKISFQAENYRAMADEIRSIASEMGDAAVAESMRQVAADYDVMAQWKTFVEDGERDAKLRAWDASG